MADASDLIAKRRRELEQRLAALSADARQQVEEAWRTPPTAGATPVVQTVRPRGDAGPAPMSYAQELLWLMESTTPGHAYNVPRVARLVGSIDLVALRQALDAVVARHAALRTTFDVVDGRPSQIVHPPATVDLECIDLTALAGTEQEAEARRRVIALSSLPFDLRRDPQLRASIIHLGKNDNILVLVSHHIASDAWSGNIVLRDLATLYDAFRSGAGTAMPPSAIEYADYATWQRAHLTGQRLADLLQYWRTQLAGAPLALELPTDRPRSAVRNFDGAVRSLWAGKELPAGVRRVAGSAGATPFMVYLATLQAVLFRYTGQTELIVGSPVAGRVLPELDGVVGFFANTFLLRGSLSGTLPFRALLEQARKTSLGALDHQELPLEKLLLERDETGSPLAATPQVMILTEDPDRQPFVLPGTERQPFSATRGAIKFDLTLHVAEGAEGLRLALTYRTDLFDEGTIDRMLIHYRSLLESAIAAPDTTISELAIMPPEEYRTVVECWNATSRAFDNAATVHGLVAAQATRTPNATAIVHAEQSATYGELHERASAFAARLRAAGVTRGTFVGVCVERSIDLVAVLLAVQEAGGAYVPLDPAYPRARIEFMLEDTAAPVLVTDKRLASQVPWLAAFASTKAITVLDAADPAQVNGTASVAPVLAGPQDLAYVIYTSGSTGRPKAVLIEHRNAVAFISWAQATFTREELAGVLASTSVSFDLSLFELFATLAAGGTVVIGADVLELPTLRSSHPVTLVNTVPSAMRELVRLGKLPPTVRTVNLAGELLPQALVDELYALPHVQRVYDLYGPSETTTYSTFTLRERGGVASIGKPIANTTAYVLDEARRPVPVGIAGELYIGGTGVARGYLDRPELTAERFLPDPFDRSTTARMYRTGDRVRWRSTGQLELLGRLDAQVKLRGHRIELGEVEHVLSGLPQVEQAVAVVREDAPGDQRLVGYIILRDGRTADAQEMRMAARQLLPAIMVPASIVFLTEYPRTPNGKVDRKRLRPPDDAGGLTATAIPETPLEAEIAGIWRHTLSITTVGTSDDFFDLGGNSLLAMRMMAEVERRWDQRIPFQAFFEKPTIANIAAVLLAGAAAVNDAGAALLQQDGLGTPLAFVHGDALGYGWYSRRLAPLLGTSPLIVLPTLGPRTANGAFSTEAIAGSHVAALRGIQPHGPYRVGGFCHGALIAYEMARQLTAAGEMVERLVMVDPFCSNLQFRSHEAEIARRTRALPPEDRVKERAAFYGALQYRAQRWRQLRRLPLLARVRAIAAVVGRKLGVLRKAGSASVQVPQDDGLHEDRDLKAAVADARATLEFVARAQRAFMPAPYDGKLVLIWAREAMAIRPWLNRWGGWNRVAPQAIVAYVPGTHIDTISPMGLPRLAEQIRQALHDDSPLIAGG